MMNQGQVEDSVGGGVCQVSTTLYNALLEAELQIDVRYPHSMEVSYVKPSKDAAIATGSKDLVFTNNKEYPIYIEGTTNGYEVSFTIYGKEDRPSNRKVEYISVEDKRIPSYAIEVPDASILPEPIVREAEATTMKSTPTWRRWSMRTGRRSVGRRFIAIIMLLRTRQFM